MNLSLLDGGVVAFVSPHFKCFHLPAIPWGGAKQKREKERERKSPIKHILLTFVSNVHHFPHSRDFFILSLEKYRLWRYSPP